MTVTPIAPRLRPAFRLGAAATIALASACGGDAGSATAGGWEAVRDTVGDTVVVRTVAGSVWGDTMTLVPDVEIGVLDGAEEYMFGGIRSLAVGGDGRIWVMDGQVPALRVYGPDGTYLRTVGGEGEGPGEYKRPDGGLTVLSDGRVVLRDPSNARFNVYSGGGESLDTWIIRGNFNTGRKLYRDTADAVWTLVLVDPEASVFDWVMGLAEYGPDGTPGDTLVEPDFDYEPPTISGSREGSTSVNPVPFSPSGSWAMSPLGYLVAGVSTEYAFTLYRDPAVHGVGPLRIERTTEPVPVAPAEGRQAREAAARNMRNQFPGWKWNGADVPDTKPPFRSLYVGEDGRIWVALSRPGREVENPDHDPSDPDDDGFPTEWREGVAFDVFEPDGRYLGLVRGPDGMSLYPEPTFGADHVWAVVRDEYDVQRVVRFRIEPADGLAT